MTQKEMVKNPDHYNSTYSVECKDINVYLNSYLANVCKYLYRWDKKGTPEQDLLKAKEYLNFYNENFELLPTFNYTILQWEDMQKKLDAIVDEAEENGDMDRAEAIYALFLIMETDNIIINKPSFSFIYSVGITDLDYILEGRQDLMDMLYDYIDTSIDRLKENKR